MFVFYIFVIFSCCLLISTSSSTVRLIQVDDEQDICPSIVNDVTSHVVDLPVYTSVLTETFYKSFLEEVTSSTVYYTLKAYILGLNQPLFNNYILNHQPAKDFELLITESDYSSLLNTVTLNISSISTSLMPLSFIEEMKNMNIDQQSNCLPSFAVGDVIVYNKNLFSFMSSSPPESWALLTNTLKDTYKNSPIIPFVFAGGNALSFMRLISSLMYSFGGGYDTTKTIFNSEENINAISLFKSWFESSSKEISSISCLEYSEKDIINLLLKGTGSYISYISNTYFDEILSDIKYSYILLPGKQHFTAYSGYCYTIHPKRTGNINAIEISKMLNEMVKKDRVCLNEKIIPVGVKCDRTSTVSPSYNIYYNSTSVPLLPQFKKYKYKAIELIHSTLRNMIKKDYAVSDTMNKLQNSLNLLLEAENGAKININEIVPFDIEESNSSFNIIPFIIGIVSGFVIILLAILIVRFLIFPFFCKNKGVSCCCINDKYSKQMDPEMSHVSGFIDHEIRNVLTGIIGIGDYLEENVNDIHKSLIEDNDIKATQIDVDLLDKNIVTLNHACELLTSIVNDGMDIRKLREGELLPTLVPYRFSDLVERVFHILQPKMAEAKNVKIQTSIFDKNGYYKFDKHRVQQVLMNFLTNALKYTEDGTITVRITEDGYSIVRIAVEDTGRGIPEKRRGVVFDSPFKQIQITDAEKHGGSGLGLFLCKIIVQNVLKGNVGVDSSTSKDNHGSTFWFNFPTEKCQRPDDRGDVTYQTLTTMDMTRRHVLIIDDSELSRKIIVKALKICHGTGDESGDGPTALRLVQNGHYDSIIIELNIPQMSGYSLATFLRKELNYLGPLIAITSDNPKEVEEQCKLAGFDEIITKPIQPRELVHILLELGTKYARKGPYHINRQANLDKFIAATRYRAQADYHQSGRSSSRRNTSTDSERTNSIHSVQL